MDLRFRSYTRANRVAMVRPNAVFIFFAAMLPAFIVGGLVSNVTSSTMWIMLPSAAVVLVSLAWSVWNDCFRHVDFWEYREWLDFSSRTWHSQHQLTNSTAAPTCISFDFDELLLLKYSDHHEQGISYEVCLCTRAGWNRTGFSGPDSLSGVFSSDEEHEALACILALSELWKISSAQWEWGRPPSLKPLREYKLKPVSVPKPESKSTAWTLVTPVVVRRAQSSGRLDP